MAFHTEGVGQRRTPISDGSYVMKGLQLLDARVDGGGQARTFCRNAVYIAIWYFCSAVTLILNKYVLSYLGGDPDVLACGQISTAAFCGGLSVYASRYFRRRSSSGATAGEGRNYDTFYRDIGVVGAMRFGAVLLGLLSLKNVAASFTETIKASAPLFTVIIAYIMLGERSGVLVNLSLLPIMGGLVLTSYTELSFTTVGFLAAMMNNLIDCIQNVFCKKLLSGLQAYTASELQFYTSFAAVLFQVPMWILFKGTSSALSEDWLSSRMLIYVVVDCIFFHLQSLSAYLVVSVISPVAFSVSNTAKRALLLWLTIAVFHNPMTLYTVFGTLLVIMGVFCYNFARQYEKAVQKMEMERLQTVQRQENI